MGTFYDDPASSDQSSTSDVYTAKESESDFQLEPTPPKPVDKPQPTQGRGLVRLVQGNVELILSTCV